MEEQKCDGNEDFEIIAIDQPKNPQDTYFNKIIMILQEIVLDSNFEILQNNFMKNHCQIFQPTQENKVQYTQSFSLYQNQIEKYIQTKLIQRIPTFNMNQFMELLESRNEYIDQQLLQILTSFTDFQVFKEIMLEFKKNIHSNQQTQQINSLTVNSNQIIQSKKNGKMKDNGKENIYQ